MDKKHINKLKKFLKDAEIKNHKAESFKRYGSARKLYNFKIEDVIDNIKLQVYTTLEKSEKYKSTVFIDTFTNRFGDASGGLLFNTLIVLGLSLSLAPIAIIPLAIYLSMQGRSIATKSSI